MSERGPVVTVVCVCLALGVGFLRYQMRYGRSDSRQHQREASLRETFREQAHRMFEGARDNQSSIDYFRWGVDVYARDAWDNAKQAADDPDFIDGYDFRDALLAIIADRAKLDSRPEVVQCIDKLKADLAQSKSDDWWFVPKKANG